MWILAESDKMCRNLSLISADDVLKPCGSSWWGVAASTNGASGKMVR